MFITRVGEHVQRHLSRHFGQRLHRKVRRPHPHLQRAERMLASTHRIRILVQTRLHGIDNVLMFPTRDAALRSLRALSLQCAGPARVAPAAVQDQSIFLVREAVDDIPAGWSLPG